MSSSLFTSAIFCFIFSSSSLSFSLFFNKLTALAPSEGAPLKWAMLRVGVFSMSHTHFQVTHTHLRWIPLEICSPKFAAMSAHSSHISSSGTEEFSFVTDRDSDVWSRPSRDDIEIVRLLSLIKIYPQILLYFIL